MKKIIAITISICIVSILILSLLTFKGTKAALSNGPIVLSGEEDRRAAQSALVDTAYAFYHRGKYLQYDSESFVKNDVLTAAGGTNGNYKFRSRYDLKPEEIDVYNISYDTCGHFIENVYYETFNKNGEPYSVTQSNGETDLITSRSIEWHSNRAMYQYPRALLRDRLDNQNSILIGHNYNLNGNVIDNSYYEVMDNTNTNGGIYYYINKYYYDDDQYLVNNKEINISGSETINNYKMDETIASEIVSHLEDVLQVGDILLYDRVVGTSVQGHVAMCVATSNVNGREICSKFMHSYGLSYDLTDKYDSSDTHNTNKGTIRFTDSYSSGNGIFDYSNGNNVSNSYVDNGILDYCSGSGCYWQAVRDNIVEIGVFRPLNIILASNKYSISDVDGVRSNYNRYLTRSKSASVDKYESVNPGDEITYTVTLKYSGSSVYNIGRDYDKSYISDTVPANTTLVYCEPECDRHGNEISWNVDSIDNTADKVYSFTVRVNDNTPLGTRIVSNKTEAIGAKLSTIETEVNRTLDASEQSRLKFIVNEQVGDEYNSSTEFIQNVYTALISNNEIMNFDFTTIPLNMYIHSIFTTNNIYSNGGSFEYFSSYIDYSNNVNKMLVKNLFGGRYVMDSNANDHWFNDGRELYYDNDTLMVGDVLVIYDRKYETELQKYNASNDTSLEIAGERELYLYLGDGNFAVIPQHDKRVTIFSNKSPDNRNANGSRLIDSLMGQSAFAVLRPSYAIGKQAKGDVNGDCNVDIKDAKILAKYIIEKRSNYDASKLILGDMNDDGKIKMNDVIAILKK